MPFEPDDAPTRPDTWQAVLRQMAERVRASEPGDVAVLQMLRDVSTTSDEDMLRYMSACARFVDRILG